MKIKLTQPGYENFSDWLGTVAFVNGVSGEVTQLEADRIASIYQCEFIDSSRLLPGERLTSKNVPGADKAVAELQRQAEESIEAKAKEQSKKLYTESELGEIADKEGLAGIRTIADKWGVRGKSIRGLIAGILQAQGV